MGQESVNHYHTRKAFGNAAKTSYNGDNGAATSLTRLIGKKTGIPDAVATSILRLTIPNGNYAGWLELRLLSSNGGADAFESSRIGRIGFCIARTTGVDTVTGAFTIANPAIATVAAGATHTLACAAAAVSGAASATQTIDIQVTIDDSGDLGSNQCMFHAELMNAEASGITIAAV